MKIDIRLPFAATTLLMTGLAAPAFADDIYQPTSRAGSFEICQSGANGAGCTRFQGYIYVGHGSAPAAVSGDEKPTTAGDSTLGRARLYVHIGSDEVR